jgi:UDP-N-acetylmuramate dehydrogenase
VELAELTTLRLGGPAGRLVEARTDDEVITAIREAEAPVLVLAGGSNVVVADEGVPGTVVRIATRGVERDDAARIGAANPSAAGATRLVVAAGESWDDLVALTVAEGLQGFECLSGIPGSVGGTPIQNVGAYGQEVSETIESVRLYDRDADRVVDMPAVECGFGYRTSAFRYHDRHVVLSVTFRLRHADRSGPLGYAQLARTLGVPVGGTAPLADVREAVLALRRAKGMVIDPADPDSVSAGSFFTNPILEFAEYEAVADRAGPDLSPSAWAEPDGRVKLSAAWLIERAGFQRGHGNGKVGISTKHTLALVNRGGASTAELMALAREIAAGVEERFGVSLHPEPVLVGHSW